MRLRVERLIIGLGQTILFGGEGGRGVGAAYGSKQIKQTLTSVCPSGTCLSFVVLLKDLSQTRENIPNFIFLMKAFLFFL